MNTAKFRSALVIGAGLLCVCAQADQLKDPTQPPVTSSTARGPALPRSLNLEAILQSADRYVAIVDGKIVRVGDQLGNARIEEITTDSVRYSRGGREHTIRLARRSVKVRHATPDTLGMNHE
jgi:MSHA biogenesis protein MshK